MTERASGVGLGFRHEIATEMFATLPREIAWVEIHPENYIHRGGGFRANLEKAREHWPILTHGLTQCVGSPEPLDRAYAKELKTLLRAHDAPFHSEHLCFGSAGGVFSHDLLPLPFTRASRDRAVARIRELRDALECDIAVENISYYVHPGRAEQGELDFVLDVVEAADAKLLLDVNNIFVNSVNHGFDPRPFVEAIPHERVVQLHVAGHFVRPDGLIIDTHSEAVPRGVNELVELAIAHTGDVPILLERDGNYPPLEVLLGELRTLEEMRQRGLARRPAATPAWESRP